MIVDNQFQSTEVCLYTIAVEIMFSLILQECIEISKCLKFYKFNLFAGKIHRFYEIEIKIIQR